MRKGMIKKWFHSKRDDGSGRIQWQGQILSRPEPGIYLVQLYDWIFGDPGDQILVKLSDMKDWNFYDTSDDMNFAYEQDAMGHEKAPTAEI